MDKYNSFVELSKNEKGAKDGKGDYQIYINEVENTPSISVIAPHGGDIEPYTSLIARKLAKCDFSLYLFEGIKDKGNYRTLHITSTNFDEPKCLDLLSRTDLAIAIHGKSGDGDEVLIGGLNKAVSNQIHKKLSSIGFSSRIIRTGSLSGTSENNICNKTRSNEGIQIEIMRGLRDSICTKDTTRLELFTEAIRNVLFNFKNQYS